METLKPFSEFETKYEVSGDLIYSFKKLISSLDEKHSFQYIESDDIYYTKGNQFLRHRFDPKDLNTRQELTFKKKNNVTNNIYRVENNIRVDGNSVEDVEDFVSNLGFEYNFRISKYVNLYKLEQVTLPFYTVISQDGELRHFIEIEINEKLIPSLTENDAWHIIQRYERLLSPLGITAQNRLRKSLFEMYRR